MQLNPKIYLQTSAGMTILVVGTLFGTGLPDLASGVLIASFLLILNLFGWIWGVKTFISIVTAGSSSSVFTIFTMMKFILLATTLLIVWYFFGPWSIVISNSIVVTSLLVSSLYIVIQQTKGLSYE